MRKIFIAGNWKMHKTVEQSVALAQEVVEAVKGGRYKYMIAPSFPALYSVSQVVKGTNVLLGAQNMNAAAEGAHTGEVSFMQLVSAGVQVVILGHSERRHTYKETDEEINAKVLTALEHGLEVILCVGETLEQREAGKAEEVCKQQTEAGLRSVTETQMQQVTIAYEPVWAIGTGKTATPDDAQAIHAHIRKTIAHLYNNAVAENVTIQYGGSMKGENAQALLSMPDIDGGLIGGASLKANTFAEIALCSVQKG
ncbi:MAG: triose-phosphate isomerase [Spirochaetaceae bacterium]|nr:triose-phosphate isomerase [Spirochaetaceae bacterium]